MVIGMGSFPLGVWGSVHRLRQDVKLIAGVSGCWVFVNIMTFSKQLQI
jgi:hypothetical protein